MLAWYTQRNKEGGRPHICLTNSKMQKTALLDRLWNEFQSIQSNSITSATTFDIRVYRLLDSIDFSHTLSCNSSLRRVSSPSNPNDEQLHHSDACPNTVGNLPRVRRLIQERRKPRSASSTSTPSLPKTTNSQTKEKLVQSPS